MTDLSPVLWEDSASEWDVPCISSIEVIYVKRTERFFPRWNRKDQPHARAFLLLGAAFVLGAGLGMLAAWLVGPEGCGNLRQFFSLYSQIAPDSAYSWANFLHTLWYFLRLPLLFFLVGFSALGVFVVPAAMLCKGFSFAFAISTLTLLYGPHGLLAAAVFFGLAELFFIPVLFLVAVWSMELASGIAFGRPKSAKSTVRLRGVLAVTGGIVAIALVTFLSFRLLLLLLPQYMA